MKKIVFLGSKKIASDALQWLLSGQDILKYKIIAIGSHTTRDNPVHDMAVAHRIAYCAHQDDIPVCDYIISVQYHDILSKSNIEKAGTRAVNLHLAPVPEYRGCNQFSFAIMNEEAEFGVTLHSIDERIDHGYIISERRFAVGKGIWVEDLWKTTNNYGLELLKASFSDILNENYTLTDWKTLGRPERLYYRKDILSLKQISLETDDIATIDRKIRATSMPGFEPPFFLLNNKKIHLIPSASHE